MCERIKEIRMKNASVEEGRETAEYPTISVGEFMDITGLPLKTVVEIMENGGMIMSDAGETTDENGNRIFWRYKESMTVIAIEGEDNDLKKWVDILGEPSEEDMEIFFPEL